MNEDVVTLHPGDVSTLSLLEQDGKITASTSWLCFESTLLLPAVIEALQAAAKSMAKYVLGVHRAPPDLERLVWLSTTNESVEALIDRIGQHHSHFPGLSGALAWCNCMEELVNSVVLSSCACAGRLA